MKNFITKKSDRSELPTTPLLRIADESGSEERLESVEEKREVINDIGVEQLEKHEEAADNSSTAGNSGELGEKERKQRNHSHGSSQKSYTS